MSFTTKLGFICILVINLGSCTFKDYYDALGLTSRCSLNDVKKAYRASAMKYHPDRNKAPDAGEKFAFISEAHSVLSDANKRALYDKIGHEAYVKNPNSAEQPGSFFKFNQDDFMGSWNSMADDDFYSSSDSFFRGGDSFFDHFKFVDGSPFSGQQKGHGFFSQSCVTTTTIRNGVKETRTVCT